MKQGFKDKIWPLICLEVQSNNAGNRKSVFPVMSKVTYESC